MPVELLETKPPTAKTKTKTTTTKTTTTTNDDDHNNNNNNNNNNIIIIIIIIIHEKLYPFCLATCVPFRYPCSARVAWVEHLWNFIHDSIVWKLMQRTSWEECICPKDALGQGTARCNEVYMHMHFPCQPSMKRAKITWNVHSNARNNPQHAKHIETAVVQCDRKKPETSTPIQSTHSDANAMRLQRSTSVRGATLKMQNLLLRIQEIKCHSKNHETSTPVCGRSEHDRTMNSSVRNPPVHRGYLDSASQTHLVLKRHWVGATDAFQKVVPCHQKMPLPKQVTSQYHQILALQRRKVPKPKSLSAPETLLDYSFTVPFLTWPFLYCTLPFFAWLLSYGSCSFTVHFFTWLFFYCSTVLENSVHRRFLN